MNLINRYHTSYRGNGMIHRNSLRRLLKELHQRKADIEGLIVFFEKYGRQTVRRRNRAKRFLRLAS